VPQVQNGEAVCPTKLKPGALWRVRCYPGYIKTPGRTETRCKQGGLWSRQLQCEIPLLLVSGGIVGPSSAPESGMELISLHPSTGCEVSIPDMPSHAGSHRSLHNLLYVYPGKVLACNGLTSQKEATCDAFDLQNLTNPWVHHSFPNEREYNMMTDIYCSDAYGRSTHKEHCRNVAQLKKERKKGVYAAQSMSIGNKVILAGGMLADERGHAPTNVVKRLSEGIMHTYWPRKNSLQKKRAFFCAAVVKDSGYLAVGGLSKDGQWNSVERSVEFQAEDKYNREPSLAKNIADLNTPRSGHGCTVLNTPGVSVLVSGGTKGFEHGESALAGAEILNATSNTWVEVAPMKTGRFGHAVVAVGDKIIAVGGDTKVPSNILNTMEEYDTATNSWNIIEQKLKRPRANFAFTLLPHSLFDGCVIKK